MAEKSLNPRTVKIWFKIERIYCNPDFELQNLIKDGEWNCAEVEENELIKLAIIKSKHLPMYYQIRLDWKAFDKIKVDKVEPTDEGRNRITKGEEFKGRYAEEGTSESSLFNLNFEDCEKKIFKGNIKVMKKRRTLTFGVDAILKKQAV